MTGDDSAQTTEHAERVDQDTNFQWRTDNGTLYTLTNIPTGPCWECDRAIGEHAHCHFREGPDAEGDMDHVCWDCGQEVAGYAR